MNNLVTLKQCQTEKRTIGQRHIYTQELIKALRAVKASDTIEYETLSRIIGIDVRPNHSGYNYQKTARDILEKDESIVFEPVDTVGLRRMLPEEVAKSTGEKYLREKKSSIKRNKRRIETVDDSFESLSPEAQLKTTFTRTILAFDSEVCKRKNMNLIESKVAESKALIGFDSTISLFSK